MIYWFVDLLVGWLVCCWVGSFVEGLIVWYIFCSRLFAYIQCVVIFPKTVRNTNTGGVAIS